MLTVLTIWSLRYFGRYQPFADLTRASSLSSRLDRVSLQVQNATVVGRVNGRRRWRVSCGVITLSRDRRQITVDGIRDGILYDSAQHAVVSVSAAHATYAALGQVFGETMPAQGLLRLTDGIRATLLKPPGLTLQTDRLTWDALRSEIACSGGRDRANSGRHGARSRFDGGHAKRRFDTAPSAWKFSGFAGRTATDDTHDLSPLRLTDGGFFNSFRNSRRCTYNLSAAICHLRRRLFALAECSPDGRDEPGSHINQDDAYLKTQAAVVNLDDQQRALNAKSQVPVHLYNPQDDLTGSQGFIDFTRHLATLENKITLVVKPGPREAAAPPGSLRNRFKDPATLTCDKLTYDYRAKIAHVPGPLTFIRGGAF